MSDESKTNPQDIAVRINEILDEESTGKWVYMIPVSSMVELGLGSPGNQTLVIAAVCRQVLKRLIKGNSRESIETYLRSTIGFKDERFVRGSIGQTMDAAKYCADIIDGKMTEKEVLAELLGAKNADENLIRTMIAMVLKLHQEDRVTYSSEKLRGIWKPPEKEKDTPGFCLVNFAALALWPVLWFGFGFRWWTSVLLALLFLIVSLRLLYAVFGEKTEKERK